MCAHTFMILCVALFLCMCARVNFCMSTVHRHARAGAEGERVWNRAWIFQILHSKFWCQCISVTIFCSLIILSSMQYALWSPWRTYPSCLRISFPVPQVSHLRTIINIPSESPWPAQDSCRSEYVTSCVLPCPLFAISHIALRGVC